MAVAAVAAGLMVGAGVAPADAADGRLELVRSTIKVYDDIEVRFPGCTARALGSQLVATSWDAGVVELRPGGDYGYDSDATDQSATVDTARQPFAYTAGPGRYTITGECVTVEGRTLDYGSAQLTVQHSAILPSTPDEWALVPGQNVLANRPDGTGFRLVAQRDGNLVQHTPNGHVVWNSGTHGAGTSAPVMQKDGNLVIRRAGKVIWQSGTGGNPGARLAVQSDGNLVIYSAAGKPLWHTWNFATLNAGQRMPIGMRLSSADGRTRLVPQSDGNLVLYGPRGALWSTRTTGSNVWTAMQGDGNFVLYRGDGKALWSTGRKGGTRLRLQNDGNLVMYDKDGRAVWSTGTRV